MFLSLIGQWFLNQRLDCWEPNIRGILQAAVCLCDLMALLWLYIAKEYNMSADGFPATRNTTEWSEKYHRDIIGTLQAAVCLYDPLTLPCLHISKVLVSLWSSRFSVWLHITKLLVWLCFLSSTDNTEQSWNYYRKMTGLIRAAVCLYDPLALQIL